SNIRKARRVALKGHAKAAKGFSLDEFPFASSYEGGKPTTTVRPIKVSEQNKQGGKLSSFYQTNNIKDGSPYIVKIVP
ncbi:MAG: NucA/NucB deoxyribonuclease domain-containing protein, partial [Pseudomonadota bacterium]|nr:NucA/NucB deoxyribonuclease domain-containing protein [Pseudomonadota bacterium]